MVPGEDQLYMHCISDCWQDRSCWLPQHSMQCTHHHINNSNDSNMIMIMVITTFTIYVEDVGLAQALNGACTCRSHCSCIPGGRSVRPGKPAHSVCHLSPGEFHLAFLKDCPWLPLECIIAVRAQAVLKTKGKSFLTASAASAIWSAVAIVSGK